MPQNRELNRHSIRIPGYDYTQWGGYFVTVCSWQHLPRFGEITEGEMTVNEVGQRVRACWEAIPAHFPSVELDEFVVMPNHVHGILLIKQHPSDAPFSGAPGNAESFGRPVAGSLPTILRSFKAAATREFRTVLARPELTLWQRNYYEHVVRDEDALNRIRQYIIDNPARWEFDPYNPDPAHRVDTW